MEHEIEQLTRQLMTAVQRRDMDLLDALLGADFTLTTGRAGKAVRGREEWLEVTAHEYVLDAFVFEELVVQHYGTCAVVRSRYRQRAHMGDQARNTTYRMTDVWVQGDGGWKLQARHAQPVDGD